MFDPAENGDAIRHASDAHQPKLEQRRGGIDLAHQAFQFRIEAGCVIDPPFADQPLIAAGSDWGDLGPLPAPKIDEQDVPRNVALEAIGLGRSSIPSTAADLEDAVLIPQREIVEI
jgi:hypothetical protein